MKIFRTRIYIYFYKIALVLLTLFASIFIYNYFSVQDPKWSALLGGLATGLIVAIIQLILMWSEYTENEKIKELKIIKILPHRDNEQLYRSIIEQSKKKIDVLGNTAQRFLEDFADKSRQDKKALLDAFSRNVKVRFLLPDPVHLDSTSDKLKAQMAGIKITELIREYGDKFECRYYDHKPSHNLILADSECLVGPIFPKISSKNSPAIYTDESSAFVKPYIDYFKDEWDNARKTT